MKKNQGSIKVPFKNSKIKLNNKATETVALLFLRKMLYLVILSADTQQPNIYEDHAIVF